MVIQAEGEGHVYSPPSESNDEGFSLSSIPVTLCRKQDV